MTLEDLDIIERIVRHSTVHSGTEEERFETWLGVDQDQALAVIGLARLTILRKQLPG